MTQNNINIIFIIIINWSIMCKYRKYNSRHKAKETENCVS